MKNHLRAFGAGLLCAGAMFLLIQSVEGFGRGGGGGGGRIGGGGGNFGGGGARIGGGNVGGGNLGGGNFNRGNIGGGNFGGGIQRPAIHPGQSIQRPNLPQTPSIRPGGSNPGGINRPGNNAPNFNPGSKPSFNPGSKPNFNPGSFNLPGNHDRPTTLPANRPAVNFPGNRPDFGKPGHPSAGDLNNWMHLPNNGGAFNRPNLPNNTLPRNPDFSKNFNQKFTNALNNNKFNNTYIKNGDRITNVNLSNNQNFQSMRVNANNVNNNLRPNYNNWFHNNWWHDHPCNRPWWHCNHGLYPANYWWRPATWVATSAWIGAAASSPPVYYDYGSNVVVNNDQVYVNQEPVASAPVYAQQAIELADVAPPPQDAKIEWLPLGTWGLSGIKDDNNPNFILQLAVSKEGLVSGVWYTRSTEKTETVEGKVDNATQRVAIRRPDEPDQVLEVGLYNLTQQASTCMMHFGTLQSQTWYLSRLEEPKGDGNGALPMP